MLELGEVLLTEGTSRQTVNQVSRQYSMVHVQNARKKLVKDMNLSPPFSFASFNQPRNSLHMMFGGVCERIGICWGSGEIHWMGHQKILGGFVSNVKSVTSGFLLSSMLNLFADDFFCSVMTFC